MVDKFREEVRLPDLDPERRAEGHRGEAHDGAEMRAVLGELFRGEAVREGVPIGQKVNVSFEMRGSCPFCTQVGFA